MGLPSFDGLFTDLRFLPFDLPGLFPIGSAVGEYPEFGVVEFA
jgi:hypothetical protein